MKHLIRCWLIAVLISAPAVAHAANCRAVVVRKAVVVEKVAVAAIVTPVVAQFVPVPVALYSAVYQPAPYAAPAPAYSQPVAPVASSPCPDHTPTFKQIAQLLLQLDQRLSKIEGGTGQPPLIPPMGPAEPPLNPGNGGKPVDPFNPDTQPPAPVQADRLLALATRHCSACHDKSRATASGKGFVLLEGGKFSASLAPESLGKIIDELASKRMPKGTTMPDTERLEMIALLVSGK